jgi:hypothetical protein
MMITPDASAQPDVSPMGLRLVERAIEVSSVDMQGMMRNEEIQQNEKLRINVPGLS